MNTFVFDIETVPDTKNGRIFYQLENKSDKEVAEIMIKKRQEKTGAAFLPHHLQRIVAISGALRSSNDCFKLASLGHTNSSEKELITSFFRCIEKYLPILVSWNGSRFDLPVLHYRALLHGVSSPSYWNIGDDGDTSFRWNNYLSRYHYRHSDLMDILAGYQGHSNAPLTEIALMLGLPGKLGMDGSQVWDYFLDGKLEAIRNYCETDVLNTYLIYLRFELIRGKLTPEAYQKVCTDTRNYIAQEKKPHFEEFIKAWKN